jgi:hypothetical protein
MHVDCSVQLASCMNSHGECAGSHFSFHFRDSYLETLELAHVIRIPVMLLTHLQLTNASIFAHIYLT